MEPHSSQLVRDHSLEDWHTCTAWGTTSLHVHVRHRVIMPVQVHQAEQDCSIFEDMLHIAWTQTAAEFNNIG
ncbi:TPA: hypothetical protein ACH3X1_002640 [Trebouxia sp. C0004]